MARLFNLLTGGEIEDSPNLASPPAEPGRARLSRANAGSASSGGFFAPVSSRALAGATGQLALMLKTGTSLVDALNALAEQRGDDRLGDVLRAVATDVSGGSTLCHALSLHPRVFDTFYVSAVRAGEASGRLAQVFKRLEVYLQKRVDMRASIITALIYPSVVTVMAIVAVTFIVTFVLPKFSVIFARSNVALPLPTRMLMALSTFLTGYWYLVIPSVLGLLAGVYLFARSRTGARLVDDVALRLPILGSLTNTVQSSMLLRTLGTLLDAGVTLVECLDVARDACRNFRYREFVSDVSAAVLRGEDLSANFAKSGLMSPAIKQMVATGERTGSLPEVLNAVADHLDDAADKQMKKLSAIFEPMAIIVMGVAIGFIAVAVLMPLFKLTSAVKGGA